MMCALFDTHTPPTTALLTSFVKSLSTDLTDDELNELNPVGRLTAVMSTQIGLSHLGGKTTMGCESLGDRHACVYSWLFQQIRWISAQPSSVLEGIKPVEDLGYFLFGQTVLQNMYLVFDFGKNQTGIASPVGSTTQFL
ncbi:hypothetical protein G6F36_012381 [Rhizopus arrhizus]|nr:hypothetical protein G6F36_012381 [Rhizopus arrhizus]